MSQRIYLNVLLSLAATGIAGFSPAVFAESLTIGDANTNLGQLQLSGWLRANYQDKDYSTNDHKLKFDAAKIALKYDAKQMFGAIEYRCYQSDTMCDLSTLVNANIGYKLGTDTRITAGLQDMPFGPSRAWSSSWYGSGLDNAGLDDVHNLGLNVQHQLSDTTKVDLAYFVRDGGSFAGSGGDSARFSANYVEPTDGFSDHLKEKNMWVARVKQEIPLDQSDLKLNLGGSYWHSDLENKSNGQTGHRNAWNVFSQISYQAANLSLIAGQNRVDNQSAVTPDYSTVGSFDSAYYVANKGNYYVADFNYRFKDIVDGYDLSPYWTYTIFNKDKAGFATSTRNILGLQLDVDQLTFAAEYVIGKNDVFIGGDEHSLVAGDSAGHSQMLNLMFMYNF